MCTHLHTMLKKITVKKHGRKKLNVEMNYQYSLNDNPAESTKSLEEHCSPKRLVFDVFSRHQELRLEQRKEGLQRERKSGMRAGARDGMIKSTEN